MARIAVLSDIHGHAEAFRSALSAARREGFDAMLILGDLLTYGVEPDLTLDIAQESVERDGATLILGNHDQLYLDLDAGASAYADALPTWIRDSVDWTRDTLRGSLSDRSLPWVEAWSHDGLFAAHANPFEYGDWTYLSGSEPIGRACSTLAERGSRWGVFGHTHRPLVAMEAGAGLATVGSLGQPRDGRPGVSQWAMLTHDGETLSVGARPIEVDWSAHMAAIRATSLPESTKDRLCGFFS